MIEKSEFEPITNEEKGLLKNLTQILVFPSWSKLIGNDDFKGIYLNQLVHEILKDNVVILPDMFLTGEDNITGEPYILITGVGIYYTIFRLKGHTGTYITDYKAINGCIIPLNTYEKAKDVSGSVVNTNKLMMTELLNVVPFSLILAKETIQTYLRNVISRNVIFPYKDCFNKLVDVCKDPNSLNRQEGYKILSGGLSTHNKTRFYNEILTEMELESYSKIIVGIKSISPKVSTIIHELQLDKSAMKKAIFEKIQLIKNDFVTIGYPKLLDWLSP